MSRVLRLLVFGLLGLLCAGIVLAQEVADKYIDIPKSRTTDGAFVLGDPDAGMKLIEFADFLCTSCQNYKPVITSFIREYVRTGKAQLEYRIFPVVDRQLSALSASLVECADKLQPGIFWRAHDLMFEITSSEGFTSATGESFSSALGMAHTDMEACVAKAGQYSVDAAYGASLGVTGTPSLFVKYGDSAPVPIALALPEHYPAIVNAIRPDESDSAVIEHGRYAGISTFRRGDGGLGVRRAGCATYARDI